jgi:ATP-dependent DNA helicase RecG
MQGVMERQLSHDIEVYQKNFAEDFSVPYGKTTSEKIIALLRINPRHSTRTLAAEIGISTKGIEKQLAKLKAEGKIERIGSAKGGHWLVS